MIVKSKQKTIELVARPGKSVQKSQTHRNTWLLAVLMYDYSKVEMIKIALVVRPVLQKAVDRP